MVRLQYFEPMALECRSFERNVLGLEKVPSFALSRKGIKTDVHLDWFSHITDALHSTSPRPFLHDVPNVVGVWLAHVAER